MFNLKVLAKYFLIKNNKIPKQLEMQLVTPDSWWTVKFSKLDDREVLKEVSNHLTMQ